MKSNTENSPDDAQYTVQSEEAEPLLKKKKKTKAEKASTMIWILLMVTVVIAAVFIIIDQYAYTFISTPAPEVTTDTTITSSNSFNKYSEDKHCIILAGMEIYPDDAPKLYNFLLEFYSSYSDVHMLSESDYTNQDGSVSVRGYSAVDDIGVTLALSSTGENNISCYVRADGNIYSKDNMQCFILSNGSELGTANFHGDKFLTLDMQINQADTVYMVCASSSKESIFIFPISEDVIANLGG